MTKITKREIFTKIKEFVETGATDVEMTVITDFCDKEIAALDSKAAKAKERAAKKAAEGDPLKDAILATLTDEFVPIADIVAAVGENDEDVTVGKVTYRLTSLVKDGKAQKQEITVETNVKKRKVQGYAAL